MLGKTPRPAQCTCYTLAAVSMGIWFGVGALSEAQGQSIPSSTQLVTPILSDDSDSNRSVSSSSNLTTIRNQLIQQERLGKPPATAKQAASKVTRNVKAIAGQDGSASPPNQSLLTYASCPSVGNRSNGFSPSGVVSAQGISGQLTVVNSTAAWRRGSFVASRCNPETSLSLQSLLRIQDPNEVPLQPQISYDSAARHFFVSALSRKANSTDEALYIAVIPDTAAGPLSADRSVYRITLSNKATSTKFCKANYGDAAINPLLGISAKSVAVTADTMSQRQSYGTVFALDKTSLLARKTTRASCFNLPQQLNITPSNVLNPRENSSSMVLVTHSPLTPPGAFGKRFMHQRLVWQRSEAWSLSSAITKDLPEEFRTPEVNLRQPGTTTLIDVQKTRFMAASTQVGQPGAETVYNVHSISCKPRENQITCLRFYNIPTVQPISIMGEFDWYYTGGAGFYSPSMVYNGRNRIFATASHSGSAFYPGITQLAFDTDGKKLLTFISYTSILGSAFCADSSGLCQGNTGGSVSLAPNSGTTVNSQKAVSVGQLFRGSGPTRWKTAQVNGIYR